MTPRSTPLANNFSHRKVSFSVILISFTPPLTFRQSGSGARRTSQRTQDVPLLSPCLSAKSPIRNRAPIRKTTQPGRGTNDPCRGGKHLPILAFPAIKRATSGCHLRRIFPPYFSPYFSPYLSLYIYYSTAFIPSAQQGRGGVGKPAITSHPRNFNARLSIGMTNFCAFLQK